MVQVHVHKWYALNERSLAVGYFFFMRMRAHVHVHDCMLEPCTAAVHTYVHAFARRRHRYTVHINNSYAQTQYTRTCNWQ